MICVTQHENSQKLTCRKIEQYLNKIIQSMALFLFSLTHTRQEYVEKVLFWGQIFQIVILTDLHILRSPEYKNLIFSNWFVCRVCVCYQHNSKTNLIRNFKFSIQHLYKIQLLFVTFYEDRKNTFCIATDKGI